MDFDVPPNSDPRRIEVREWIVAHPEPSQQDLADAGYVVPHWPRPWGLDADPIHQLVIEQELRGIEVVKNDSAIAGNPIGIGWAAPTLLLAGTEEQQRRYLPRIFNHDEFWCQLFSEPEAGSDLASLSTRAEKDGDVYVINRRWLGSRSVRLRAATPRIGFGERRGRLAENGRALH